MSNFPNGFASGLTVRGVPILNSYSGNIYWVNSASPQASAGGPGTMANPFNTINNAMASCVDSNGDIILVAAGHTETISAAGGITNNKIGVAIIGMGEGSNRPVITFDTATTASWLITAASTTVQNIVGVTAFNAVVAPFDVRAADTWLDIEMRDTSTSIEAVSDIVTTAAADRLYVNLRHLGFLAGSAGVNTVKLVGVDGGRINVDFYGSASTAVVNFATTACTDIVVTGSFYNGTTALTKDIVDTVTGSKWSASGFDGVGGYFFAGGSGAALAANDSAALTTLLAVPSADAATNVNERDVVGNKTDASVYVAGTTNSIAAYVKGHADLQERIAVSATAVMVNGNTIFTIAGGPIQITSLVSECITANDTTASTVQYAATATGLSQQTISAACTTIASAATHATVSLIGTALSTAAVYNANGVNLGMSPPGGVVVPVGVIKVVIGVGSTTGTWRHILRYKPLVSGVTVS